MNERSAFPDVPDSLSPLIRTAVSDARALDPAAYEPKYNLWHSSHPAACFICDAGAVVAGTLIPASDSLTPNTTCYPNSFPHAWEQALHALDAARSGCISDALAYFRRAHDPGAPLDPSPFFELDDKILDLLGPNEHSGYTDWDSFHAHLAYMERVAEQLDAIAS